MILTFSRYLFLLAFCVLVSGVLETGEVVAEESSRSWLLRGQELSERGQYQGLYGLSSGRFKSTLRRRQPI